MAIMEVKLTEEDKAAIVLEVSRAVAEEVGGIVSNLKLKAEEGLRDEVLSLDDGAKLYPKLSKFVIRQWCTRKGGRLYDKCWRRGEGRTAPILFYRKDLEEAYFNSQGNK